MSRSFYSKLNEAMEFISEEPLAGGGAPPPSAAPKLDAQSIQQKNETDVRKQQQKNVGAQSQADQLYRAFQKVKQEADAADRAAAAKQDVKLFTAAASVRKRMEQAYKAYQMVQQKALGQQPNPSTAGGIPPEAAPH